MNSAEANVAFVNPELVGWAIKRSGFTYTQIAKHVKASEAQIQAWERGTHPPFDKAQQLAEMVGVPFGYLFLSSVPSDLMPIKDFRMWATKQRPQTSINFREVVRDVLVKRDWYRDYLEEEGEPVRKFVGKFTMRDGAKTVADDIRRWLHLTPAIRAASYTWGDYMRTLTKHAEEAGILVMRSGVVGNTHKRLSAAEFQGFAISDDLAPLIFINSSDFVAAQIFTFAHELAHIWLGQSAVSNPNPANIELGTQQEAPPKARIEAFCNQVAVEALVPRIEFANEWRSSRDREKMLEYLSRYFWVSNFVVLRRAFELSKISKAEFLELREQFSKKTRPKQKLKRGLTLFDFVPSRMSRRLTGAVLNDLSYGRIMYRDAATLLSLNVPTLTRFAQVRR